MLMKPGKMLLTMLTLMKWNNQVTILLTPMKRSKPYIHNVSDPQHRWTISFSDFAEAIKKAIKFDDKIQLSHLLDDFWICDDYVLLKSDIQGGEQ